MDKLTYALAPYNWAICFQHDCPLAEQCLRHAIALLTPAGITQHNSVLPTARKGDVCSMFATNEPQRIARGMRSTLPRIYSEKITALRHELYKVFGNITKFYRYRDGKYDITPEQQNRIEAIFRLHGVKEKPTYDSTTLTYYFPRK